MISNAQPDLGSAVAWLEAVRHCTTPASAVSFLQRLQSRALLLGLYQEIFPDEFKRSTKSLLGGTSRYCSFSAREWEFLELLQSRFPIDLDIIPEMMDEWDQILDRIPIERIQPYCWLCRDYEGVDELELVFRLALALVEQEQRLLAPHINDPRIRYTQDKSNLGMWNPEVVEHFARFEKRCRKEKSPLADLPLACRMVEYSTGNSWLDWYCEMEAEFNWARADIDFLTSEYKDASAILKRVYELDDWLKESPAARLTTAINIWNRAAKVTKDGSEEKGIPLIDIL